MKLKLKPRNEKEVVFDCNKSYWVIDRKVAGTCTLECLIQEHVRLFFLKKKSTLCALIRHYSIIMIRPCTFIIFFIFFHPVRLLSPVRLLGRSEYSVTFKSPDIFDGKCESLSRTGRTWLLDGSSLQDITYNT